jgi:hypothetical protein
MNARTYVRPDALASNWRSISIRTYVRILASKVSQPVPTLTSDGLRKEDGVRETSSAAQRTDVSLRRPRRRACRTSVPPRRPRTRRRRGAPPRSAAVGRIGVGLTATAVVVLTLLGGGTAPASKPGTPHAVVVERGITLWDLAARYAPEGVDVRAWVDAVIALNDLGGPPAAGERVRLPR